MSSPTLLTPIALDELDPQHVEVGYGELGRRGWLGYEGSRVTVRGRVYGSALSTHAPARVRFAVPPGTRRLSCHVALNDDVAWSGSSASFTVLAGGRAVTPASFVRAGAAPVPLVADLAGAHDVELVVTTGAWEYCHAVWLDPVLDGEEHDAAGPGGVVVDPLRRADISVPPGLVPAQRCIATVASAGFEQWVDDLLGSVRAFGGCPDAHLVVFALGDSPALEEVAARHGATVVHCRPLRRLDPTCKSVLYAVARVIPAERFVCLDADMLVLGDLGPLFAAIDACRPDAVLLCGEGNDHGIGALADALDIAYGGGPDPPFFARGGALGRYPFVVNDGLLAGGRVALTAFEAAVRALPDVVGWVDERPDVRWRNQFAANVAVAGLGTAIELDPAWNLQLHVQDVDSDGIRVRWHGRDVRVLHFSGVGKHKCTELRGAVRAAAGRVNAAAAPERSGTASNLRQRPWRTVEVPAAALAVPTMLSVPERRLLHWLARDHVTGVGRIVDGGSFLGGSTAALASGLAARSAGHWDRMIASYDLFRVEEYTLHSFADALPVPSVGASFRPAFTSNIAPWARYVEVREGDATVIGWSGEPIEVLFLDMVKTWELNDLVCAQFLPCLVPGRSVLVQQDYHWGYGPWTHLTMELLDGSVEILDVMPNGSVVYLLTAPVPPELVGARLRDLLSPDRMRELMDRAVARWEGDERGLVELARVMLFADLDGMGVAHRELAAVLARHPGSARVEQCAAVIREDLS